MSKQAKNGTVSAYNLRIGQKYFIDEDGPYRFEGKCEGAPLPSIVFRSPSGLGRIMMRSWADKEHTFTVA